MKAVEARATKMGMFNPMSTNNSTKIEQGHSADSFCHVLAGRVFIWFGKQSCGIAQGHEAAAHWHRQVGPPTWAGPWPPLPGARRVRAWCAPSCSRPGPGRTACRTGSPAKPGHGCPWGSGRRVRMFTGDVPLAVGHGRCAHEDQPDHEIAGQLLRPEDGFQEHVAHDHVGEEQQAGEKDDGAKHPFRGCGQRQWK